MGLAEQFRKRLAGGTGIYMLDFHVFEIPEQCDHHLLQDISGVRLYKLWSDRPRKRSCLGTNQVHIRKRRASVAQSLHLCNFCNLRLSKHPRKGLLGPTI